MLPQNYRTCIINLALLKSRLLLPRVMCAYSNKQITLWYMSLLCSWVRASWIIVNNCPTRCDYIHFYYISADSSTCFGWYPHPSSGAHANCNYSIWHWANRNCCSDSSTSSDGSKYGSNSARCCNYCLNVLLMMVSTETCRVVSRKYNKTVYCRNLLDDYWHWHFVNCKLVVGPDSNAHVYWYVYTALLTLCTFNTFRPARDLLQGVRLTDGHSKVNKICTPDVKFRNWERIEVRQCLLSYGAECFMFRFVIQKCRDLRYTEL